jgi:hypothetical protein
MIEDYLQRATIVKPFNKALTVKKILNEIVKYTNTKNMLTIEEKINKVQELLRTIMNQPELFAIYPKFRDILNDKYYEFISESHREIISDIPIFLQVITKRSDYVNMTKSRYNLRKREPKNYKV